MVVEAVVSQWRVRSEVVYRVVISLAMGVVDVVVLTVVVLMSNSR